VSESSERIRAYWSRFTSGDRAAQLTLSGSAAAVVLVLALIAWSVSGSDNPNEPGSITDRAADALSDPTLGDFSSPTDDGGSNGTSVGSGSTSSGSVSAPGGVPDVPKDVALTKDAIKIGIAYNKDPGTANAAAGFAGIGQVDQKLAWDTMIKEYNKAPPFGRKIVPVYYATTTDDITSKGQERIEQEACAHYTQDNKVFMVWGGVVGGDTINACLTKKGIPLIGGGGSRATYARYPYMITPTGVAMERMAEFEIDQLVKQNFFKVFKDNQLPYTPQKPADGKARIGLIRYDEPEWDAGAAAMKKRLASHGLSLCSGCEFEIAYSSDNIQEQLDDATEINAAIQNCKSRPGGPCTHMVFLGTLAGVRITLFFVDGAEKQQYRPRLGFNPLDAPQVVADTLGEPSYPQFRQSVVITDSPAEFKANTPAWTKCKDQIEAGGQDIDDANTEAQMTLYCDTAWYTRAVLEKAGETLSLQTFMNGVHTMAPTPSSSAYLMQTKQGRHDGSGAVRAGAWSDDCHCYKPSSGIVPV